MKTTMPSSDEKKRKAVVGKSVQWSGTCSVRFFAMPDEQRLIDTWYQANDYKTFKRQRKTSIVLLAQEVVGTECMMEKEFKETCEGLEHFVSKRRAFLCSRQLTKARDTVLNEQAKQRRSGSYSPDRIAKLYHGVSEECQVDAHQQALQYHDESRKQEGNIDPARIVLLVGEEPGVSKLLFEHEKYKRNL
jgi:hypothetical protein